MVLVVVAVTALLLGCLDFFYFLPAQQQLLKRNLMEKAKAISILYGTSLSKSIETNDDISLLIQIDRMMKLEDVSTVFVVDNNGKVLLHDKSGEWGKTYSSEIIKRSIEAKKQRWEPSSQVNGYLYSAPLTSSSTLFVGLSTQKNDGLYGAAQLTTLILSGVALVLIAIVLILFTNNELRKPLLKLTTTLKSIALANGGTMEQEGPAEFREIIELINVITAKTQEGTVQKAVDTTLLQTILDELGGEIVVIDGDNRICCMNAKASATLSIPANAIGTHILDAFKASIILEGIQAAQKAPGTIHRSNHNGQAVTVKTVFQNNTCLATIILCS
jgi:hypothetical protein